MKWEQLKLRVSQKVITRFRDEQFNEVGRTAVLMALDAGNADWRTQVTKIEDAVRNRIVSWDVRCVGKLREIFPEFFPKALQRGTLVAYMEDTPAGDWVVELKQTA